jgi:predicted MFS family arabinose efflux permease
VVFTLWLLVFAAGTQAMLVAPIIPQIAAQLGVEEARLGVLVTSYAVAVGAFALVTGPISDRVGRRTVLLVGTALMAVALALHGLADTYLSLVAVRALAGVAGGVLNGAAIAYVGDFFAAERRGRVNGWVISGFAAGQVAGIPVGTLLADAFGYRAPFLLFALVVALSLGLVFVALPQPTVGRAGTPLTFGSAVGGYRALLARRDVAAATVVFFVMFGGSTLYMTFLPTWLTVTVGVGAGAIATLFLLGGLSNAVVGPLSGSLSDRVGRKRIIVAASVGLAALMALTPFLGSFVVVAGTFVAVMALFASRATSFTTMLTELVDGDQRGSLMSLTVGVGQVGVGVGGALAGTVYGSVGYTPSAVAAGLSMLFIAALVLVFLPSTGPTPGPVTGPSSTPEPTVAGPGPSRPPTDKPDLAPDALCGPMAECGYSDDD